MYFGHIIDNIMEGKGKYISPEGDVTTGDFHRGEIHGYATRVSPDNSTYSGQWQHGLAHGSSRGIITIPH